MNAQTIKVELDWTARACYIRLSDATVARTEPFDDDMCLFVDLDDMDEVVGIEILDLDRDIPLSDLCRQFHIREKRAAMIAHLLPSVTKTPLFTVVADPVIGHGQTITMQKNTSRLAQH
ncbi:DUF2283 domain-containing protein [Schaalia cardiffensis]|nr:DUF2283 domain-containing protein [Schaalia cardiffensis]MBJ2329167.1 DUF2283 domain-containing protein [Schaalia cardiffensis]